MNGNKTVAELLKEVVASMLSEDTDEVSLDVTLPIDGQKVLCTFDLILTSVSPVDEEDKP